MSITPVTLDLVESVHDPTCGEDTRVVEVVVCPHCHAIVYPPLAIHTDAMHAEGGAQ